MHHLRVALRGHRQARGRGARHARAVRRQLTVTLTPEGEARAREVIRTRAEFESRAFDCLDAEERDRLVETLDRVAARWAELESAEKGEMTEKTEKGDGR